MTTGASQLRPNTGSCPLELKEGGNDPASSITSPFPGHVYLTFDDIHDVRRILMEDLWAADLEKIAVRLWIMSTQSSANINPLHRQLVKGRRIIVTEDPRLHLAWIHDRIFVKPLPEYLLSRDVWDKFLPANLNSAQPQIPLRKAALGFLRTYCYLIKRESDFHVAQRDDLHLVPKDIGWSEFRCILARSETVLDTDVSQRYHYGELRLSRLNFYAPILLLRYQYEDVSGEYSIYFMRFYAPAIFGFTVFTTILSALQVELAIDQVSLNQWSLLWNGYRWFALFTLLGAALLFGFLILLWTWFLADEWIYAFKCRFSKSRQSDSQTLMSI